MEWLEKCFYDMPEFLQAHGRAVGEYARFLFCAALRQPDTRMPEMIRGLPADEVRLMGQYHDIGKSGISDRLWKSSAGLTETERRLMFAHTILGAHMLLGQVQLPEYGVQGHAGRWEIMADCCLYHHERWDGKGYPFGIGGEAIPYLARLVGIADAYGAMTADRPYHKAATPREALEELQRELGRQFDPVLTEIFCKEVERKIL